MNGIMKYFNGMCCLILGSNAARRGDVIRCTVMFEDGEEREGKLPVVFSVNGSRIVPEDKTQSYIEYRKNRPLFPYIAFRYENSVLAKVNKPFLLTKTEIFTLFFSNQLS